MCYLLDILILKCKTENYELLKLEFDKMVSCGETIKGKALVQNEEGLQLELNLDVVGTEKTYKYCWR